MSRNDDQFDRYLTSWHTKVLSPYTDRMFWQVQSQIDDILPQTSESEAFRLAELFVDVWVSELILVRISDSNLGRIIYGQLLNATWGGIDLNGRCIPTGCDPETYIRPEWFMSVHFEALRRVDYWIVQSSRFLP